MSEKREVRLRIRVVGSPPGVTLCLQRGRDERIPPTTSDTAEIVFDLTARVDERTEGTDVNWLGPFTQGPRDKRFVYVNSGRTAGQFMSPWTRRAKISLMGISRAQVDEVLANSSVVLEVRYAGTGRDGGPSCASVPLLDGGWRVVPCSSE